VHVARAVLEIADDGRGPEAHARCGQGLDNMRARAARLGGELLVGPAGDKRGTTVRLSTPAEVGHLARAIWAEGL
jgi:signal transduction histidine kinase